MDETNNYSQQDINASKGLAFLSYLGLLFLIPMLVNKDSAFTKFHVNQGIVFFIACIILNIVAGVASALSPVAFLGSLIVLAVRLVILALMIIGIVNAAQGKAKRLPVIGNIEIYK